MDKPIYLIKSSTDSFKVWKTYNAHQPEKERIKDIKNNYPIISPNGVVENETRIDCVTDEGYFYGMQKLKGNIIGIVFVKQNGIFKTLSITDGYLNIKNL